MLSIDGRSRWIRLSQAEQLSQWRSFLVSLDAGDAGYHPYYTELMPRWDRGDVPLPIEAEYMATRDAELRAEAVWETVHRFGCDGANAVYGEPPF